MSTTSLTFVLWCTHIFLITLFSSHIHIYSRYCCLLFSFNKFLIYNPFDLKCNFWQFCAISFAPLSIRWRMFSGRRCFITFSNNNNHHIILNFVAATAELCQIKIYENKWDLTIESVINGVCRRENVHTHKKKFLPV